MVWDLSPILGNTTQNVANTSPATTGNTSIKLPGSNSGASSGSKKTYAPTNVQAYSSSPSTVVSTPTTKASTAKTSSGNSSDWVGQNDWDNFWASDPGFTVDNWAGGSITLNGDGTATYFNDNIVGGQQQFTANADIRSLAGAFPEIYMQYADTYGSNWADGFTADNQNLSMFNPTTGMECDTYGCGASHTQDRIDGTPSLFDLLAENPIGGGSNSTSFMPTSGSTSSSPTTPSSGTTTSTGDGSITFPTIDNHAALNAAIPGWIDQFSQGIDNYFDAYGNLVDLPNQIDAWTQNAVNRQRVTGEDISNVLSAVANQRNAQGIMGGTESDNLGATTISNLGKIITENQNNLLSNANNLKASAISAQPGQAQLAINDLLSLYGMSAQESASWGQMAMNLLMNNF